MKATNAITTVNNRLCHSWLRETPGKVLGALAVGGLIMAAAVLTPSSAFADEPSRPLSVEASQEFGSVIHDMAEAARLAATLPSWGYGGYGSIDDVVPAALLGTKLDTRLYDTFGFDPIVDNPVGAPKLDTRLHTNGMDFVEEPGVGKVFYSESAGFGPLSDMIAAAELDSAGAGNYTFWADFQN